MLPCPPKMWEPQVSHYIWESRLPPSDIIGTFSDSGYLEGGVLAGKEHSLNLTFRNWFNVRFDLVVPKYLNAGFHVPEARVQLISISDAGAQGEFLVSFARPSYHDEGPRKDCIQGRISCPILRPCTGTYLLRLHFTLQLEKTSTLVKDLESTDASFAFEAGPEQSAIPDSLFRKTAGVRIVCGQEDFVVHKELLTERSPVFRQMFESEMTEALTGKLVLDEKEIAPTSVLQLLRFLYTGKMEDSKEVCRDLFIASEKYDMKVLKAHCENYLTKTLIPEDAAEHYDLAETHNGILLKAKSLDLLKKHKTKLFPDSDALLDFGRKYPQLMFQLFMN